MARPGLEPGTPRFSDVRSRVSNRPTNPANKPVRLQACRARIPADSILSMGIQAMTPASSPFRRAFPSSRRGLHGPAPSVIGPVTSRVSADADPGSPVSLGSMEWVTIHCGRCGVTYETDRRLDPLHHSCRCEFCGGLACAEEASDPRLAASVSGRRPLFGALRSRHREARGAP